LRSLAGVVTIAGEGSLVEIVGRDQELDFLETFLNRPDAAAVVLEGEAGIGKSTLWRAAVSSARARGLRVLEARPAETERGFAYSGLTDLLEPALDDVLPELAAPRRRALEVAFALAEEPAAPVDPRTLAIAVRNALEVLGTSGRVVVAVDDVQWLDASSATPLAFALRRLDNVSALFSRRLGEDSEVDIPAESMRVGPLSMGATQRLVQATLGTTFARPTLLRVHEASGGNPFYALELARALLARDGVGDPTRPLPVPDTLEGLVRARLDGLPEETRDALALAAAHGRASPELLRAAGVRDGALDAAEEARVIEVNGAIRFTHPLLASALYNSVPASERRRAHARLAEVVGDRVSRARQLALSTDAADPAIAAELEHAAQQESARGAAVAAAELGEHAVRLTPADATEDRHRRTLAAAKSHLAAGEADRARTLAEELERSTLEGSDRAEALLLLAEVESGRLERSIGLRRQALAHTAGRPDLEASIEHALGLYVRFSEGMEAAEAHVRRALDLAEELDDDGVRAGALGPLSLLRFNAANEDARGLAETAYELAVKSGDPGRVVPASFYLAHIRVWSGRLDEARSVLEHVHDEWGQRDERTAAQASWYLAIVEVRACRLERAQAHAERARELQTLYSREETEDPTNYFPLALVAAHRGDLDRARELAAAGRGLAERQRALLGGLQATCGIVELWSGDATAAVELFEAADRIATKAGWVDPGIRWWRDEHIEALLELGRLDDAVDVLAELESLATRLQRPWALAQVTRCRGLIAATRGDVDEAASLLEEAAERHEAAGDPLGHARALLALGVVRRRTRQKRVARDAIDRAVAAFSAIGAEGWADKARAELGRISGRRRDEGLSAAEQRVAALVAEGRTNREVAAALFLGERTVESHLTRVYDKLGVRSRAELASKFGGSHDFKEPPPP
jgi:DNA-binding CsgD family transcriptional regulator